MPAAVVCPKIKIHAIMQCAPTYLKKNNWKCSQLRKRLLFLFKAQIVRAILIFLKE
jgi:hypothetical protein